MMHDLIEKKISRRSFLVAGAAVAAAFSGMSYANEQGGTKMAAFTLPNLPYPADALEPYIDAQTMNIHHGKHHQTYVDRLNDAVAANAGLQGKSLEDLLRNLDSVPENARAAVRNHGGGHANHALFWLTLKKDVPFGGDIANVINSTFGSLESFKEKFSAAAAGVFGSGWAWLVVSGGKLEIVSTPNQDSPLTQGKTPILGIDVWEHAYYLKYQNRRPEYVSAFFNVINWDQVGENLKKA